MYSRHLAQPVLEALGDTPVVLLTGARQVGKSTLAASLFPATSQITFDDLDVLSAATADPVGFVARLPVPAVLDEVQRVPELFLSLKAAVDRDRRPGRFLLTGSANVLSLPRLADSLAGRMALFELWPLSRGELEGSRDGFVDAAFSEDGSPAGLPATPDLVSKVLVGGYPDALARASAARRAAWFRDYLTTLVSRDVRDLANIAGLTDLPRLLRLIAARASGVLNQADLARDAGLNAVTFRRYLDLLGAVYLSYTLPAWASNPTKRLVKAPKLYLTDSGLLAHLLGLNEAGLERDRAPFGALLENFVASELRKQLGWSETRASLHHYRTHDGTEVDLVLEDASGRLVGIEVKASSTVTAGDFKGLKSLAADTNERFHRGVVLHSGERTTPFGERLDALPVSALWHWQA